MDERETERERERERERESEHRLYCDAPTINQYDPRRAATPFAIMCDSFCTFACVAAAVAAATEARNLMNIKKKKEEELEKKREKKKRVTYKESQRQALRIRHTIYRSVSRRLLAL